MCECTRGFAVFRPTSDVIQALGTAAGSSAGTSSSRRANSSVTAELQREIEEALPARGSFKEKFGAAGVWCELQQWGLSIAAEGFLIGI